MAPPVARTWNVWAVALAIVLGSAFGIFYARFAMRLSSRSRAATVLEQARAVQEFLLASNPEDGLTGKWVLRRRSHRGAAFAPEPQEEEHRHGEEAPHDETPPAGSRPVPAAVVDAPSGSSQPSQQQQQQQQQPADFPPPAGTVRVSAVAYTRQRILAFRNAVMGGGATGSAMPMDTQDAPCDQEPSMIDPVSLAKIGVLKLPYHHFSARYSLDVPEGVAAWMAAAGAEGEATVPAALPGGAADVYGLWAPAWAGVGAPPAVMTVQAAVEAKGEGSAKARVAVDADAHTRALAYCVIENSPSSWYWRDNDRLRSALEREHRYPPLMPVFGEGNAKAIARALFREARLQPVPQVLTFFNVVVSDVGYVFVPQDAGAAPRVASAATSGRGALPPHFRPIMCLYREFDHSRGGNDARYGTPVGLVHDEVIVLSQFWGDAVFHIYQEDFIRLASMLDYAAAHPHVKLHVMTPHSGPPHTILREVMDLFGIDQSRAVYGHISARIAHVPEGQPCGEPYAVSQVLLREAVRERLGLRPALDVWGDGSALRHGLTRETQTAPAAMQATSASYSASVHSCIRDRYRELMAPAAAASASAPVTHPVSAVLQSAVALLKTAPPPPSAAAAAKPVVVLIERAGSRAVFNGGDLRAAIAALPVDLRVFGANDGGSQADHLRLFAAADVVVGPHGAGLTNTLSAWPGTVVVEFIPESGLSNLVYLQSSLLLGFGFQSFTPAGSSYYGGFSVEVDRVRDVVREATAA